MFGTVGLNSCGNRKLYFYYSHPTIFKSSFNITKKHKARQLQNRENNKYHGKYWFGRFCFAVDRLCFSLDITICDISLVSMSARRQKHEHADYSGKLVRELFEQIAHFSCIERHLTMHFVSVHRRKLCNATFQRYFQEYFAVEYFTCDNGTLCVGASRSIEIHGAQENSRLRKLSVRSARAHVCREWNGA